MTPEEKLDLDLLRKDFAQRISALIGDEKNNKNLENFAKLTGVSLRQLSQWRNEKQINWPSATSIMRVCWYARLSPTWLLFGKGRKNLKDITEPPTVTVAEIVEETVAGLERLLEEEKPRPKQAIFDAVRRYGNYAARKANVEDVPPVPDSPIKPRPASKAK